MLSKIAILIYTMGKRPVFYILVSILLLVSIVSLILFLMTFLNNGNTPVPGFLEHLGGKPYKLPLNEIGDAVGGMSAPVIGIVSTILIFYSFQEQYRANTLLVASNKAQDIKANLKEFLDRIERKLAELPNFGSEPLEQYRNCVRWQRDIPLNNKRKEEPDFIPMLNILKNNIKRAKKELHENVVLIDSVESVIDSANFYVRYLTKITKQKVTPEMKDILDFYYQEFQDFCAVKIDRQLHIRKIETDRTYQETDDVVESMIRTNSGLLRLDEACIKLGEYFHAYHIETVFGKESTMNKLKGRIRTIKKKFRKKRQHS